MKLSKRATTVKRKVLDMYPSAKVVRYYTPEFGGRYGILVPDTKTTKRIWLETTELSSSTREKAWIDAYNYIMQSFMKMLEI